MWTEQVLNPKMISSIFKSGEPSLKQIKMQEIALIFGDDLLCRITFDLKNFPTDIPIKWVQSRYNKVQISLALIDSDVKLFSVTGGAIVGDLLIDFKELSFEIEFKNDDVGLIFKATTKWINIDKISGYIDAEMVE